MRPVDEASKTESDVSQLDELTVPGVQETVEVTRKRVDTGRGVRIPIDRIVTGPEPPQRYEGETLVVPVLEEVLVFEKRLRLKEEVRITRRQRQVHQPQRVSLRTEEVSVERFDEKTPGGRHG